MRKLMRKVAVFLFVIVMSSTSVLAEDFNWVQWCEGNGIYSVAGLVAHGSLTTFEACEMIIIPSYEAGVIGKRDIDNFVDKHNNMWYNLYIKIRKGIFLCIVKTVAKYLIQIRLSALNAELKSEKEINTVLTVARKLQKMLTFALTVVYQTKSQTQIT